jgi:hypothetical protein
LAPSHLLWVTVDSKYFAEIESQAFQL